MNSLFTGIRHNYEISSSLSGGAEAPRPMGSDALSFGCVALGRFQGVNSAFIYSLQGVLGLLDLALKAVRVL